MLTRVSRGVSSSEPCDLEIAVITTPPSSFFHCVQTNFHVALFDFQVTFLAQIVLWCGDLELLFCFVLFCFTKWDKLPPFFLPSPSPFFECLFGEGNYPYFKVQNSSTKWDALTLAPRGSYLMAGSLSTKWGAAREFLVCGELWFVASAGHYFVLA